MNPVRLLRTFALIAVVGSSPLLADKMVVAYSAASVVYLQSRMQDGKLLPQGYVFKQGDFFGGNVRDRTLENMPFLTIAQQLAVDLKEQSFFPAASFEQSDLLLVVHWGATEARVRDTVIENLDREHRRELIVNYGPALAADVANLADPQAGYVPTSMGIRSEVDFEFARLSTDAIGTEMQGSSTAKLLGFTRDIRKEQDRPLSSEREKTLRAMLDDSRYFIIVMAYDCQKLIKEKKLVRLWTSRLSIPSPGVNFAIALSRMSKVGAQYFGTEQTELKMTTAKERTGKVILGDMIVIESDVK